MPTQVQKTRTTADKSAEAPQAPSADTKAEGDRLRAEMDDLLDEIEGVLETNAEQFVRDYVQKGGE
jgi:prokaryotic ubiquitin-like protein Pup